MLVCASAALMLFGVLGCGSEEHVNEARPQTPTRVSVAVTADAITVQPAQIGAGPEPTQQIPQNQHARQPAIRRNEPLNVVFVAANLTHFDSRLEIRGHGVDLTSKPLIANGGVTLQAELPAGVYTVSAADLPAATPGRLTVGRYRSSSENDLLLP